MEEKTLIHILILVSTKKDDKEMVVEKLKQLFGDKIKQKESPFIKSFEEMLNSKTKEVFSEDEINMALDEEGTL